MQHPRAVLRLSSEGWKFSFVCRPVGTAAQDLSSSGGAWSPALPSGCEEAGPAEAERHAAILGSAALMPMRKVETSHRGDEKSRKGGCGRPDRGRR